METIEKMSEEGEVKREMKRTGIQFNSPDDFLKCDFKISFYHEKSQLEMQAAVDRFNDLVKEILERDRIGINQSKEKLEKKDLALDED